MRAHSQGLHERRRLTGVDDVVGHLVGIQAQDARAAALAVRARAVDDALSIDDLEVSWPPSRVVTWTLRGTRHLHLVDDVRPLLALLAGRHLRSTRRATQLGVAGTAGEEAVRALRDALAGGPRSRDEVKKVLAPLGVDTEGQATIHVIRRAALEGVLCVVPGDRGRDERYVLLDDAVPPGAEVDRDEVATRLARRHLAACGPTTPQDLAAWSGLPLGAARRAWRALGDEVAPAGDAASGCWVLAGSERALRAAAGWPAGCRLLGGFDALLLSYAARTLHVPADHVRDVNAGGGMVRPVVLVDGSVAGTWRLTTRGTASDVRVVPFGDLSGHEGALSREAAAVGRFLGGPPAELIVEEPDRTTPAGRGRGRARK